MKIEALHQFHDMEFSQGWADRFEPTPERIRLFKTILYHIQTLEMEEPVVLELGIGPGFLANFLLESSAKIQYEGLDYSQPMLNMASERTKKHGTRINFTQADLIHDDWIGKLKRTPNVIVSTWALHDLFEKGNILNVYRSVYSILPIEGIFLNGDFIKPETSNFEYEGGRIKPSEHLELLQSAGFDNFECLAEFEKSVENSTTSNNYACFKGRK